MGRGDIFAIEKVGAVPALTLEDAALKAIALAKSEKLREVTFAATWNEVVSTANAEYHRFVSSQKYVRGLFSGGTFYNEAMLIMSRWLGKIYSNISVRPELKLDDPQLNREHTCIDMGADELTVGRPHPMIDSSLRQIRLLKEARDPETAVVMLDVVWGHGAHQDPAGCLAPTIAEAKSTAQKEVVHLCYDEVVLCVDACLWTCVLDVILVVSEIYSKQPLVLYPRKIGIIQN